MQDENKAWTFAIKTKKQENGLWGMPMRCLKIDRMPVYSSDENWLKHSAFCIAIGEAYLDETFEIFWTSIDGFFVKLSKSGIKKLYYKDYSLENNVLTWIGGPYKKTSKL